MGADGGIVRLEQKLAGCCQTTAGKLVIMDTRSSSAAAPSRNLTRRPEFAGTRSPGTRIPIMFSGSAARESNGFAGHRLLSHSTQRFHGRGQSKLLAQEMADESTAAHFATIFEASQRAKHLAPRRQNTFAGEHFAEYHAVPAQQHRADRLKRAMHDLAELIHKQQRPSPSAMPRPSAVRPPP